MLKISIAITWILTLAFSSENNAVITPGNCKKSDILELAKIGYSKDEIDSICGGLQNLNCCCAEVYYKSELRLWGEPSDNNNNKNIYFIWKNADLCGHRSNYMCVDAKYCGRD